jgi:hypothetical protein
MRFRLGPRLALILGLAACRQQSLKPEEELTVRRWLLCDECLEGELDSVVVKGNGVVGRLADALKGPPQRGRRNVELQARAMYARGPQVAISQQKFVEHYLDNYEAVYQSRGAVALGRIPTPEAHAALLNALRRDSVYREDVRRVLGQSAKAVIAIFAGDSQHAPLASVVRVDPTVLVRDTTTGQPLSGVSVAFQVDSGGGTVIPATQVTNSQGNAAVRWRLGPTDSVNMLRAVAAGQTVRFVATGHPPGPRVVFVVQPSDAVSNQPMTPPPQIAVQDAWGATLTNVNQTTAVVTIDPINVQTIRNISNGVATLAGLIIAQADTGFRLRVAVQGASPAVSAPFGVFAP